MNETQKNSAKQMRRIIVAAVAVVVVAVLFFSSTVTITSGTVGVISVLGAVQETTLQAGFHLKAPFFTTVAKINTQ
ncbi:MAG: hypothetical protein LBT12_03345, partial [Oscillospiraceae bacterium]|nr:hypothetical protein [Oscillospiraceae bacterium]